MKVSDIVVVVANETGVSKEEIVGVRRSEQLMQARRMVYFFAHYDLCYSYHRIALAMKRGDHKSIADGVKILVQRMIVDNATALQIVSVREKLASYEKEQRGTDSLVFHG